MNNNNKFVDSCRLLGIYNNKDVYLYSSAKYDRPRLFYISNYFYLPKWVEDHEKLTLLQAIKIINYRMKNKDMREYAPASAQADARSRADDSVKNKK